LGATLIVGFGITLSKKVKKKLSKLNLQRQKEQDKIDKVRQKELDKVDKQR